MWVVFKTIFNPTIEITLITDHIAEDTARSFAEKYAKEFMILEEGKKRSIILSNKSNFDPQREGYFIKCSQTHNNRIDIWKKTWTYTESILSLGGTREENLEHIGFYSYEKVHDEDVPHIKQNNEDFEDISKLQPTNKKID